jgi:hypothetical protein
MRPAMPAIVVAATLFTVAVVAAFGGRRIFRFRSRQRWRLDWCSGARRRRLRRGSRRLGRDFEPERPGQAAPVRRLGRRLGPRGMLDSRRRLRRRRRRLLLSRLWLGLRAQ